MTIDHVHIHDTVMGVQFNAVHNGRITDSIISTEYSSYYPTSPNDNKNHCIYGSDNVQNCVFRNLTLKNQPRGNGIILKSDAGVSKDLIIENVQIDHCRKGIGWENVDNLCVNHVVGNNISEVGINLGNGNNAVVKNCCFKVNKSASGVIHKGVFCLPQGAQNIHCLISNCIFNSLHFICTTDNASDGHFGRYDSITVQNCVFKVSAPYLPSNQAPVHIETVVAKMHWVDCRFVTEGFTGDSVSPESRIGFSHNGTFFYFGSSIFTNYSRYWTFERCHFINRGLLSVNSPIMSNSSSDANDLVHCTIRNCVLEGFRWTIRVSPTNSNAAIVNSSVINPCYDGDNLNMRSLAVNALQDCGRFVSYNNLYQKNGLNPEFVLTENYGYQA